MSQTPKFLRRSGRMQRSRTTELHTFTRPNATFDHHTPHVTIITIPPDSDWTSSLHWHETHTEFLQVMAGVAWFSINGEERLVWPDESEGVVEVPKGIRHQWRRATWADIPKGQTELDLGEDQPLVVREWTEPLDGEKERFFRNLNSTILDTMAPGRVRWWSEYWLSLQLWVLFRSSDNWPVFIGGGGHGRWGQWLQSVITHVLLWMAVMLGKVVGAKGLYEEYTPKELLPKIVYNNVDEYR